MQPDEKRSFGRTDLDVTAFAFGTAPIGNIFQPIGEDEATRMIATAWDAGVRFFDTAPFYGYTQSEHRLGAALRERPRNEFVISTKAGRLMRPDASVTVPEIISGRRATPGFCS